MSIIKIDIPEPEKIHRISNADLLIGQSVPPIKRLQQIDEDTYEEIVLCWAKDYVKAKYESAFQFGGAGDKGRDICAYKNFQNDVFDLYQCKHYANKLTYSDVRLELGKLIHYTFSKAYKTPERYYFLAPMGISASLHDLIKNEEKLKEKLRSDWKTKIEEEITKTEKIILTLELQYYLDKFDFSIIHSLEPVDFLEQFRQTAYYPYYFGGGLIKRRNTSIKVSDQIDERELVYVTQLFEAYQDYSKCKVTELADIIGNYELKKHFDRSRNCFYIAETLAQFSRDNIPSTEDAFEELKEEVYEQVIDICSQEHSDGYKRLLATTNSAKNASYHSNPLYVELKAQDKTGICHHLANEFKLKWVK
jgi:hypothetical protein